MTKRVYIAGPMTGIPEFNFPAFFAAEERFAAAGWEVVNPARVDEEHGFNAKTDAAEPHHVYMRRDLPAVAACDAIALLPGWQASAGVGHELYVARACGRELLDAVTMEPLAHETILEEAQRLVFGDRQADYGHPFDDFTRTGRMWGAALAGWARDPSQPVPPDLVALCMVLVKVSREVNRPKRDNRTDGAGYFGVVELVRERQGLA